jgi:hypothetical protein
MSPSAVWAQVVWKLPSSVVTLEVKLAFTTSTSLEVDVQRTARHVFQSCFKLLMVYRLDM